MLNKHRTIFENLGTCASRPPARYPGPFCIRCDANVCFPPAYFLLTLIFQSIGNCFNACRFELILCLYAVVCFRASQSLGFCFSFSNSLSSPFSHFNSYICAGKIQAFRHAVAFHSKLLAYEQVRHGTTIIMAYSLHMQ